MRDRQALLETQQEFAKVTMDEKQAEVVAAAQAAAEQAMAAGALRGGRNIRV